MTEILAEPAGLADELILRVACLLPATMGILYLSHVLG